MSEFLKPGDRFVEYRLLEVLGEGGMGVVFKALEDRSDDIVAIKVLSPKAAARADFVTRFEEECRFYPKLKHPNIVRMRRTGVAQLPAPPPPPPPIPFIVMDLLVGKTLRRILERYHRLDYHNTLLVLIQIAVPMIVVHDRGIVHRDLKPENIMVGTDGDEKGHVWLMDFGIATNLEHGLNTDKMSDVGTARYMAPEQVRNIFSGGKRERRIKVDHRADIYAFGVIAYEVVTGVHHFLNDSDPPPLEEMLAGHLVAEPTAIYKLVPENTAKLEMLWPIIQKCLAINPDERYQSFEEVADDLQALIRQSVPVTHLLGKHAAADRERSARRAAFESLAAPPEDSSSSGRTALPPEPPSQSGAALVVPRSSLSPGGGPVLLTTAYSGGTEEASSADVVRLTEPLLNYVPKAKPLPFVPPAAAPFVPPAPPPALGVRGTVKMNRPEIPPASPTSPNATPRVPPATVVRPLQAMPVSAEVSFALPAAAVPTWVPVAAQQHRAMAQPTTAQPGPEPGRMAAGDASPPAQPRFGAPLAQLVLDPAPTPPEKAAEAGALATKLPRPPTPSNMALQARLSRRQLIAAPLIGLAIVLAASWFIVAVFGGGLRRAPAHAASGSAPQDVPPSTSSATADGGVGTAPGPSAAPTVEERSAKDSPVEASASPAPSSSQAPHVASARATQAPMVPKAPKATQQPRRPPVRTPVIPLVIE
jgi:serine/threonine-protein kinase